MRATEIYMDRDTGRRVTLKRFVRVRIMVAACRQIRKALASFWRESKGRGPGDSIRVMMSVHLK